MQPRAPGDDATADPTPPPGDAAPRGDDSVSAAAGAEPPSRLQRLVERLQDLGERTWEAELILSAGLAVGLLQLPGLLDRAFLRADAQLGGTPLMLAIMIYTYVKLALFVTIASFLVHLVSRAYWIALLGLHSAFPAGIRWDRTGYGPIGRDEYPRLTPTLERMIDASDRFASSVLAFAFVMSAGFIMSVAWFPIITLLGVGVQRWLLPGASLGQVLIAIAALLLIPSMLVPLLDRAFQNRPPPDWLERLLRRGYRFFYRIMGQRSYSPLSLVIFTNTPKRVMYPVAIAFFVALMAVFLGDLMVDRGRFEVGTASYVPLAAGPAGIDPRHYDSLVEDPLRSAMLPRVDSEVVQGPYLRLLLPYNPDRDDALVARLCPALEPQRGSPLLLRGRTEPPPDSVLARTLACVAGIWTVSLNGDTINTDLSFYRDPATGARGLLAHLPTAALPEGRNLLHLERRLEPPAEDGDGEAGAGGAPEGGVGPDGGSVDDPSRSVRYWIPFWK